MVRPRSEGQATETPVTVLDVLAVVTAYVASTVWLLMNEYTTM
jgi:hypothetical protein